MFVQKYAMQYGTVMGLFWGLKFILLPLGFTYPILQLFFLLFTIAVPFVGFYFTWNYREKQQQGAIDFVLAWMFGLQLYFFASIFVAAVHYAYLQFFDHGFMLSKLMTFIQEYELLKLPNTAQTVADLKTIGNSLSELSAIEITFQLFSMNLFYGSILSLITAMIVKKRSKQVQK